MRADIGCATIAFPLGIAAVMVGMGFDGWTSAGVGLLSVSAVLLVPRAAESVQRFRRRRMWAKLFDDIDKRRGDM